jgi:predicted MFS family arabinose efflux permease
LIAGTIVEMFGLRWQAMIQGIAFMSHQLGSFLGALGGGLLFDALGSYDLAWRLIVGMGLTAGLVQLAFALARPWRRQADDVIMSTMPGAIGASAKGSG